MQIKMLKRIWLINILTEKYAVATEPGYPVPVITMMTVALNNRFQ